MTESFGYTTTEIFVEAGRRVACIVCTTNALPFAYMSEGIWLSFCDRLQPGIPMLMTTGNPEFIFGGVEGSESEMKFGFAFGHALQFPTVTVNVATLFGPNYGKAPPAFNEKTRELSFEGTTGAKAWLKFGSRTGDRFGFEEVRFEKRGVKLIIDQIQSDWATNSLPTLTKADIITSGLPHVILPTNFVATAGIPRDFPKNEKERKAAEQLKALLLSKGWNPKR